MNCSRCGATTHTRIGACLLQEWIDGFYRGGRGDTPWLNCEPHSLTNEEMTALRELLAELEEKPNEPTDTPNSTEP